MTDQITFEQIQLIWPIIFGAVFLWMLYIWKEWGSSQGLKFWLKVCISAVAIISLSMIALRPAVRSTAKVSLTAILSPGYQLYQKDSLKDVHRNINFIDYRPGKDLTGLIEKGSDIFLLGRGLETFDLWQLEDHQVIFLGEGSLSGISQLKYKQKNSVGSDFLVQGTYHHAPQGQQLILKGPGNQALDSVTLKAAESQKFQFKTLHQVAGKFVYYLVEKDSIGSESNRLPFAVNISPQQKLSILIINQFPSFESKYLKNFLAESAHEVVVRSQVSDDRFKYEYFNSLKKGPLRISGNTFNDFDLLIIDAVSLQKMSKRVLGYLQSSIENEGLGVFVQSEPMTFNNKIPVLNSVFLKEVTKEITLEPFKETKLPKYPFVFKSDGFLENIHQDQTGIISAYRRSGEGRIGTSVLKNTYELILDGKNEVYQSIWSALISGISKRDTPETLWSAKSLMTYQDAPYHFKVKTSQKNPSVKSKEGFQIALAQDINFSQIWTGTSFPRNLGWNKLFMEHDSTAVLDFFVMDTSKLNVMGNINRANENKRFFRAKELDVKEFRTIRQLPLWWFYLVFLTAMGYLWLEPKL